MAIVGPNMAPPLFLMQSCLNTVPGWNFLLVLKASTSHLEIERDFFAIDYMLTCLCSFAHACEGRSLQAGTPEIAIAIHTRRAGLGAESELPWVRLIPRVGMLTTTGPLGTARARQPTGGSSGQTAFGWVLQDLSFK
uniref:Uncharacterized protein n=1 Tax=Ananas comosus var. bracteatus TaxID=296719 RepID=A0A6V7NWQ1_ANACO|nr:unnamed protein product [Ananas comosus var. bracteatus]